MQSGPRKLINLITSIILVVLGGFIVWFVSTHVQEPGTGSGNISKVKTANLFEVPLFKESLDSLGIVVTDLGYHSFSPNGSYFLFTTFTEDSTPATSAYLLDIATGKISLLPGIPQRDLNDNRVVELYTETGAILYFLDGKEQYQLSSDTDLFYGTLSPNGKKYVVNTHSGIQIYDLSSRTLGTFTTGEYDGAMAWFSDNKRLLGYKETGENIYEAGMGRQLGIWNIIDGTFTPLAVGAIKEKALRFATWIVPDRIARVNAGWDDGSHDYLVNINSEAVIEVGETSASLMGGVVSDQRLGLFAVVGGADDRAPVAIMYKGLMEVGRASLPNGYFRESMAIVDSDTLLYIRKKMGPKGAVEQALVRYNFSTNTETVVKALPLGYARVSLYPDYKTWVISVKDQFILGSLQ